MRMRNKPWVNDYLNDYDNDILVQPDSLKGKWRQLLNVDEIHVEIGCGKGDYWIEMARRNPNQGWIAIEKERNCAAMALKKAEISALENIRFILADAEMINQWFDDQEVDYIHLNFSDPWPKKRNTKKRLTYDSFLDSYASILGKNGCIIMKTDNKKLFEYSLINMQSTWIMVNVSVDFRSEKQDDAITEYENRFMIEQKPIYRAVWRKR